MSKQQIGKMAESSQYRESPTTSASKAEPVPLKNKKTLNK